MEVAKGGVDECAGSVSRSDFAFQEIGGAEESGDPCGGRVEVEVAWSSGGDEAAVADDGHAVGHGEGLVLVVGDVDAGDAGGALGASDFIAHLEAEFGVEVGEGLVEQEEVRVDGEGAGEGDALLLAAGELGGASAGVIGHPDDVEEFAGPLVSLSPSLASHLEAESDVLEDAHVRPEGVVLEHHAAASPVGRSARDVVVSEADAAGVGEVEACDDPEEGRFAAAAGAEEEEQFTGLDDEGHVVDGENGPESLGDVFESQGFHGAFHGPRFNSRVGRMQPKKASGGWATRAGVDGDGGRADNREVTDSGGEAAMAVRPQSLEVWTYRIPMRIRFEHAAAGRSTSTGVLVRLELSDGTVGWGEGIPRDYVTGETLESAADIIRSTYAARLLGDRPLAGEPVVSDGVAHHAAWCACELAYLDAAGKSRRVRAADLLAGQLGLKPGRLLRRVSGVLSAGPVARVRRQLRLMRLVSLRDYKLKVGTDGDRDEANLAECHRQLGRGLRRRRGPTRRTLRVDANGAWDLEEATRRCEGLARWGVVAVEQPLAKGDEASLVDLRRRTSVPIMLDESLVTFEEAERLVGGGQVDLFNIRVSKNGGLVQSLRLARLAHDSGVHFQLGCMVGETGVLTAAGRVFLELVGRSVRFAEGSYGRFLLRSDVTRQRLSFGYGGFVRAMTGPGLGVHVWPHKVRRVGRRVVRIEYD